MDTKSKEEVFELVRRILISQFDLSAGQLVPDARLVDDLDLDSLDTLDLATQLEDETGADFFDEDLREMERLEDIVRLVQKGLGASAS
jgi:acyl carrier protein